MGKTRQRPSGLVERTRTYDGKRVHFYGRRVAEVNAKIAAYEEERRRLQEAGPLFESVAPEWWELYQQQVKNGTTRAYQGGYNSAMQEFTGHHMKEITPAVVDNWSRKFKSRGMAGGTARNARSVLSLIFKYWCIRDDQVYNPVPMTSLPRGMKKTEREPPTPAQLAAVKAHPESFGLCAWLFMYTGCRLGEVLALQWRDIDWEAGSQDEKRGAHHPAALSPARPVGTPARPARRIYPWRRAAAFRYQLPAALDLLLQGHRPGTLQDRHAQEPPQRQRVHHQCQGLGGRCHGPPVPPRVRVHSV